MITSQRKLSLMGLFICILLATSCDEETDGSEAIAINGGTMELTQGYRSAWKNGSGLEMYYHQFGLIGNGLSYDPSRYLYTGRGDLGHFTIYTSTPELPDGTYSLYPSSGNSGIENINFLREFTGITTMGEPATFKERFWPREGYLEISKAGDVYTFNFYFTKYMRYVDSDNESSTEVNRKIIGSYTGTLEEVQVP